MNKRYRLRKNKDFQYNYKRGKSLVHTYLVLIFRRTGQPNTRAGFSISRKYGNAVKRNKIKRRLKEIYRNKIGNIKDGYDLIFVVRQKASEADFKSLDAAVSNLLKRAGIYINCSTIDKK